ncbi:MAG: hypothetical protein ACKVK3_07805 [Acidimicrobiales bacterium]
MGTLGQAGAVGPILVEADDNQENGLRDEKRPQPNHATGKVQAAIGIPTDALDLERLASTELRTRRREGQRVRTAPSAT